MFGLLQQTRGIRTVTAVPSGETVIASSAEAEVDVRVDAAGADEQGAACP